MKLYTGNLQNITAAGESDAQESASSLESQLQALRDRIREVGPASPERARALLEVGRTLLRLERLEEAWVPGREAFDLFVQTKDWQGAVEACEILFLTEQPQSLAALGQGVWLAVTFPIAPDVTVAMLQHIVDETPNQSDGAAVAAAVAHYVADLRSEGPERENLVFYSAQMLFSVARRHSQVQGQAEFDAWITRLELDQPDKFLVRLRNVVDVLVQDDWWVDREAIHAELPVN